MAEVKVRCSGFMRGWRTVLSKPVLDQTHERRDTRMWVEPFLCQCGASFRGSKALAEHVHAMKQLQGG